MTEATLSCRLIPSTLERSEEALQPSTQDPILYFKCFSTTLERRVATNATKSEQGIAQDDGAGWQKGPALGEARQRRLRRGR